VINNQTKTSRQFSLRGLSFFISFSLIIGCSNIGTVDSEHWEDYENYCDLCWDNCPPYDRRSEAEYDQCIKSNCYINCVEDELYKG
jgi:hypothetical protein